MSVKIRNPKTEIRSKSEIQNPKAENEKRILLFWILRFGFVPDFGFRISDLLLVLVLALTLVALEGGAV